MTTESDLGWRGKGVLRERGVNDMFDLRNLAFPYTDKSSQIALAITTSTHTSGEYSTTLLTRIRMPMHNETTDIRLSSLTRHWENTNI